MKNLLISTLLLFSVTTQAYHSVISNGNFLEKDEYRLLVETQFLTSIDSGANVNIHGEAPFTDSLNLKATLGFGTTDINAAGYLKWVPIPDYSSQPAIGVLAGVVYGQFNNLSDFSLKINPFISKKFELEVGDFTPYASLPMGIQTLDKITQHPFQLVLGTEVRAFDLRHISFFAEAGFNLVDSFSYFSIAASVDIEGDRGFLFY